MASKKIRSKGRNYVHRHKLVRDGIGGIFYSMCGNVTTDAATDLKEHAYMNNAVVVTCQACLRLMAEQRDALNVQMGEEQ